MAEGRPSSPDLDLDDEGPDSDRPSAIELGEVASARRDARPFWNRSRLRHSDGAAGIVVASALGGLGVVLVDRLFRPEWDHAWGDHWLGAPLLCVSAAALLGLAWMALTIAERRITNAWPGSFASRDRVRAILHASVAGILVWSTAVWTFSGKMVSTTWLGRVGPALFALGFMIAVGLVSWLSLRADRLVARRRRYAPALRLSLLCFALSAAAFWADMTLYVSLYERLHTLLEVVAFALLVGGLQGVGFVLLRRFPALRVPTRVSALALAALAVLFVGSRPFRSYTDGLLAHAWIDEVYVGRTLKRAQLVELSLDGGASLEMARVNHIVQRFGLKQTKLDDAYLNAAPAPSEETQALRNGAKNIVFFYVDTLRADVADDPEIMPNLAEFRQEGMSFENAYSNGSDTLRSLPTLTSGNYFAQNHHEGDLVRLAEKADHESVLIGPRSALEFLEKHRPSFRFEKRVSVADYQEGRQDVWGYGADQPTARGIVDEATRYLEERPTNEPFFLWLFHFDQHAWRELDETYVRERQAEYQLPTTGPLDVRYRIVARSIDEQFGRFLAALERTGHDDDTIVVFVSDHGEGMGKNGFWVHSVFLWDELIHVPLVIRGPGIEPQVVEDVVSLVDVAPTLAPYLGQPEEPTLYHGVDLLEFAAGRTPERRVPIVLRGANQDRLERVGIIDPASGRKLVLRVEAALPELHAFDRGDDVNLTRQEPERTRQLVAALARSPVFPRAKDDFDLLIDRGDKAPKTAPPRATDAPPAAPSVAPAAPTRMAPVAAAPSPAPNAASSAAPLAVELPADSSSGMAGARSHAEH